MSQALKVNWQMFDTGIRKQFRKKKQKKQKKPVFRDVTLILIERTKAGAELMR